MNRQTAKREAIRKRFRSTGTRPVAALARARQFTLLELVVALVMLAGLTAIVFAAGTGITSSWERLTAEKDRFAELLVVDRTLDALLGNVVPFRWNNEDGVERPAFSGQPDSVGFVTTTQIHDIADGGLIFVHLAVADDRLLAYYQSRPLIDPKVPESAAKTSILAEGINRIELQYADRTGEGDLEWLDEWDREDERNEIPLAILLKVFWRDGREEAWLRRTAGSSRFERFGKWQPGRND